MHLRFGTSAAVMVGIACLAAPAIATPTPQENTEQVAIQPAQDTSANDLPITAQIFSGSPGPKNCRGTAVLNANLPKPATQYLTPTCFNLREPSACAVFMAAKDDGCEAKLFGEADCVGFLNLAVFLQEYRPVGGSFRSVSVRCGVESVTPPPLSLPGMKQSSKQAPVQAIQG